MIITGDDLNGITDLKIFLSRQFEMKDLGNLSYFLGIEVLYTFDGYYLSQTKYASDLLSRAGLTDNKTIDTPLENNVRFNTTDGIPLSDPTLYRQLVSSLIYLTVMRLNISNAVHIVSQFMSAPRSTHYTTALQILRYVKVPVRSIDQPADLFTKTHPTSRFRVLASNLKLVFSLPP
ncbi:uncharacterized mitochondrial protein AtMg00810-like [Actinidia eriantha]|uniref:uncharacterized mitochondrial protein AtMg00810-like n=1 Tax=Actinidia eriantha TaxID=165200 RepID=UPI00258573F9|nr:uncharacterized mitochondrial protein AtMg00810-like [Actinidia eriantha]